MVKKSASAILVILSFNFVFLNCATLDRQAELNLAKGLTQLDRIRNLEEIKGILNEELSDPIIRSLIYWNGFLTDEDKVLKALGLQRSPIILNLRNKQPKGMVSNSDDYEEEAEDFFMLKPNAMRNVKSDDPGKMTEEEELHKMKDMSNDCQGITCMITDQKRNHIQPSRMKKESKLTSNPSIWLRSKKTLPQLTRVTIPKRTLRNSSMDQTPKRTSETGPSRRRVAGPDLWFRS